MRRAEPSASAPEAPRPIPPPPPEPAAAPSISEEVARSISRVSQQQWFEAARLATVMRGLRASNWPAFGVVAVLTLLTYGHVPAAALAAMLALVLTVGALRWAFVRGYERLSAPDRIEEQLHYLHRHRGFWVLNAVSWGIWPLLFHAQLAPRWEVVCWMFTAGVGGVAIAWMSAHLRVTRIFLLSFLLTVAVAVALKSMLWPQRSIDAQDFWFPGILVGYWLLLLRIARDANALYDKGIDLAYNNARLIESLREQTRVAQAAADFKARFLAGAAHDLKQPVSALGIYAEWLSNEPELAHEIEPRILESTQAINTLFDGMFDLVKLDAGRFEPELQPVRVDELLSEIELQFRPVARQKGVALRVRRGRPLTLHTDPILLRRIVANLVANAIRYTQRGGVLLAARRRSEGVRIEVWDTGIGIAEAEQARLFDEFYKVAAPGTQEGFGLGLSIVGRLAERLGYPVSLQSRPGLGTVFRLWVPFGGEVALRNSADHSSAQSAGSASGS